MLQSLLVICQQTYKLSCIIARRVCSKSNVLIHAQILQELIKLMMHEIAWDV